MSDSRRGSDHGVPQPPRRTPFLTPATIAVIKKVEEANTSISAHLTAGMQAGKGETQKAEVHVGQHLSDGVAPSSPSAPVSTVSLSAIEDILTQTDKRVSLLVELLSAVFNDENRADKARKDEANLRMAACSLRIAAWSLIAVVAIGIAGDGIAWWYGHKTVVSGDVSDDRAIRQEADRLAITQKLADSQAAEIELLKEQLAALQRLSQAKALNVSLPPKGTRQVRRAGASSSFGSK